MEHSVLINSEAVGGLGSRSDDVLILGDCDAGVRKLAAALGWLEELEALWAKTQPEKPQEKPDEPPKTKDQKIEDEVERLTAEVDHALKISGDHDKDVRSQLQHHHQNDREGEEVLKLPAKREASAKATSAPDEKVTEVAERKPNQDVQTSTPEPPVRDQSASTSKGDPAEP